MRRAARGFARAIPDVAIWFREGDAPAAGWTRALSEPPAVYRERVARQGETTLRRWDPYRSKLGAAVSKGWEGPLPRPGERWLYLGAATGTTASHVADLVGPGGTVYAVERSLRPFARLLALSERYPNLGPVLADARHPAGYLGSVPPVDGLYVDVAQPDQVEILRANARLFLRSTGVVLFALKTASMGRGRSARQHLEQAAHDLAGGFELDRPMGLEPYHRGHFLLAGSPTRALVRDEPIVRREPSRRAG